MGPASTDSAGLIAFGWEIAAATLATAETELHLVTHWFQTGQDDSVNSDDHFGSDERTLRFLGVALPTLIDQLSATAAVVAVPWELDTATPSLSVVAVVAGGPAGVETRGLTRVARASAPFWSVATAVSDPPEELAHLTAVLSA